MVEKESTTSEGAPEGTSASSHSPITYLVIGAAVGSVASVILVALMNRQAMMQRKR